MKMFEMLYQTDHTGEALKAKIIDLEPITLEELDSITDVGIKYNNAIWAKFEDQGKYPFYGKSMVTDKIELTWSELISRGLR